MQIQGHGSFPAYCIAALVPYRARAMTDTSARSSSFLPIHEQSNVLSCGAMN